MKQLLTTAAIALALAVPVAGNAAENPIFGSAKIQKLDNKAMKSVVGQNSTSAYYAYYGTYYASVAQQYGSYGAWLEVYGSTYRSDRWSAYYSAYTYANSAASNYLYAYYYN